MLICLSSMQWMYGSIHLNYLKRLLCDLPSGFNIQWVHHNSSTTLFPTQIAHICVQLPDQVYRWLLNFPIPWSLDKRKSGNTARLPPFCSYSESSPWHTGLLKLLNLIPVGRCVTAIQQCCRQDSLLPAKEANNIPRQGVLGPPLPCADLSGKSRLWKAFGIFILHFFLIKLVGSSKGIRHVWRML